MQAAVRNLRQRWILGCSAGLLAIGARSGVACESSPSPPQNNPWAESVKQWRAHVRAKVLGISPEETAAQEAVREKLASEHQESDAWVVFKSTPSTEGLVAPEKERFGRMVGQVRSWRVFV